MNISTQNVFDCHTIIQWAGFWQHSKWLPIVSLAIYKLPKSDKNWLSIYLVSAARHNQMLKPYIHCTSHNSTRHILFFIRHSFATIGTTGRTVVNMPCQTLPYIFIHTYHRICGNWPPYTDMKVLAQGWEEFITVHFSRGTIVDLT